MRRERGLTLAWLAASGLVLGILVVWGIALGGAERTVEALDARWQSRLSEAERLFEAGSFEAAAARLERIDRDHPAVFVKHRLDRQRERVLELLARSHLALDRKGRATAAAARAARFDPLNWRNHFLVAEVAAHFGEGAAADEAWAKVLQLYPSHLPSVTGRITAAFEGGRYGEVPPLFEAYLDAWRVAELTITVDGRSGTLTPLVDGRPHRVGAVLGTAPRGSTGPVATGLGPGEPGTGDPEAEDPDRRGEGARVSLDPAGYAVRLGPATLAWPAATGTAPLELDPGAWTGGWTGEGLASPLVARAAGARGATRVTVEVTVFKALPAELWALVETSYRNVLDHEGLAAARERVVVGAPDAPLQLVD